MNGQTLPQIPPQAYDEAGEWFVQHRDGELGDAARRAFDAWLRASPQNVQAYLEISATWEDVPRLEAGWNPAARELIALERESVNVVPFAQPRASPAPTSRAGRPRMRIAFAASLALACGLTAIWLYLLQTSTYVTEIGEQRSVRLPDGSDLYLNTRTRIVVRYAERERRIDLKNGEAYFKVAPDPARPFIVTAGTRQIRALGTAFSIRYEPDELAVILIEGKVAVGPAQIIEPGERLVFSDGRAPKRDNPPLSVATAWTQRRLVFQSSPLSEVVEEFNRYNTRQLSIADPALETYRVSGVFSSTDPEPLLAFLRLQRGMQVTELETTIRITQK
jgi:transmembrane sensor